MLIVKVFALFVLTWLSIHSKANDLDHRRIIQNAMMVSIQDPSKIDFPFLSTADVIKENGRFTRSSGWYLIDVQSVASSAYDATVTYDIGKFYLSSKTRVRFISNYQLPKTASFISYGYDSGSTAEKIIISKSFFLGFSQAFNPQKGHYFFYSLGHWYGEKINETPCLDSYDREYWCPGLVAWKDRPILSGRQEKYYDLKYVYVF